MDSSPCHSPVAIVTTPSESCSPYPGSRSIHEAVHHSPYMQKPFFSIIIPAYNLENYIAAALQSVLVQIRGQGLIFTPRNLCCADVLSSRISPLAGGNPKPVKQDERFCFPLLLPTHTFFHKQLFFRIIELLEPDPAGIPPHPTGSMRSWDNSLSIHAES